MGAAGRSEDLGLGTLVSASLQDGLEVFHAWDLN